MPETWQPEAQRAERPRRLPRARWAFVLLAATSLTSLPACSDAEVQAFNRLAQAEGGAGGRTEPGSGGSSGGQSAGSNSGPVLIDDFSDGNTETITSGGWWYSVGDRGLSPLMRFDQTPRAGITTGALRATGSGCGWCFIGLDLPGEPNFDARGFGQIVFFARAEAASSVRKLQIDLLDFTGTATGVHFEAFIELGTEWTRYALPFRQFVPSGEDASVTLDLSRLAQLQFWVFSSDAYDYWIDDLMLVP